MAVNGICVANTTGGNNQTASIFAAKLDWTAKETKFNNSLINVASQIGKTLGALFAGREISKGRAKTYVVYNFLAILSCLMMQILSVPTLVIGKFLNGFFVTVVHIAAIKQLNETIPVYLINTYGNFTTVGLAFGYMIVLGLGLGLP
jgi:hypothetical protein